MSKYAGNIITTGANAGYSVAFNGSTDYLSVASNTDLTFGTGDFTVEGWFNASSFPTQAVILNIGSDAGGLVITIFSSKIYAYFVGAGNVFGSSGSTLSSNTWYHFAWVRSGTTNTFYLNGSAYAATYTSSANHSSTGGLGIGYSIAGTAFNYFSGYISNVRVIKGTALYTAAFTPPTQLFNVTNTSLLTCNSPAIIDQSNNAFAITVNGSAKVSTFTPFAGYQAYNPALGAATPGIWTLSDALQAAGTRRWNMYDPYFNLTTLKLGGNQPGGVTDTSNNVFKDSSSNDFTITRNGNTTQGSFTPFSQTGWSNYFSSGQSNYIQTPATVPSITGDYTAEAWVYVTSLPNVGVIYSLNGSEFELWVTTSNTVVYYTGAATRITTTLTVSLNAWNHVALVRSSGISKIYINGVADSNTYSSSATIGSGTAFLYLGRDGGASGGFNGYISNARLAIGAAVYTSNFTPSTIPLGATTGGQNPPTGTQTYLLTCQSNRFIDNSPTPLTLTVTGTPSVQAFSPFQTNVAYTPAVQGGSGYFNGTVDYLAFPTSNATLLPSTGQFTFELWFYSSTTAFQTLFSYGTTAGRLRVFTQSGGLQVWNGTTQFTAGTTTLIKYGGWNHVVIQRNATNLVTYVNGTRDYNAANSTNFSGGSLQVGAEVGASLFTGYISGFSYIKGSATYSGTPITLPTAPPLPTGTTALLNFTNAAIVDSTGKNDFVTVSGAAVSTLASKYGGSSMKFNGTTDYLISSYSGGTSPLEVFGAGDFTVECWVYFSATPSSQNVICSNYQSTSSGWSFTVESSVIKFRCLGDPVVVSGATSIAASAWYHVAVARQGSSIKVFLNGSQDGSATNSDNIAVNSTQLNIGRLPNNSGFFNGYIQDLRVTKGYARYTGTFTPPTSLLQNQ